MFEEIYKNYWPRIFRLCMGFVNDKEQAKDLTQETFIIVFRKLPEFRNEAKISTWIFRIATNNCLRHIENQNRFKKVSLPVSLSQENTSDIQPQVNFLYQSIAELSETERIIISLALEKVKHEDIAAIVGLSNSNVRVKIHRIKEKLKAKFKKYEP